MNETVRDRSPQSLENEIIALTHRLKCLRPALSPSMDGLTPMEAHALVLLKSSAASSLRHCTPSARFAQRGIPVPEKP